MAKSSNSHARTGNQLLDRLPDGDIDRLLPQTTPIELMFKLDLYKARKPIEHVYFPVSGVVSAVSYVSDGAAIEVATVGNEGVVGLPAVLGDADSPTDVFVQVPGAGLRMPAPVLRRHAAPGSPLYVVLVKYLSAYLLQVAQAVACNGLHGIRQRCCRWLLMTHDRVHADDLPLTHEFIGIMLGVRRASVTDVLVPLQDEGLIRSHRGTITVLDRKRLEAEACECYRIVADEYKRLLG
jgi:CRP-like cAMP-binding protein